MDEDVLSLEHFLPYRLNRLADAVSREFSAIYRREHGLTRPEWRLLATLGQYGTMTATAVGTHSSMHKTKVSRAVSALEKRRWLVRSTHESDRRVERLALTKSGEKVYRTLVPMAKSYERRLRDAIGAVGFAELERGLERLELSILSAARDGSANDEG